MAYSALFNNLFEALNFLLNMMQKISNLAFGRSITSSSGMTRH
jgi:hypothetical protein